MLLKKAPEKKILHEKKQTEDSSLRHASNPCLENLFRCQASSSMNCKQGRNTARDFGDAERGDDCNAVTNLCSDKFTQ